MQDSDCIVSLKIEQPTFIYPQYSENTGPPRPHDPFGDNGIVLSTVTDEGSALPPNVIMCHNDVPPLKDSQKQTGQERVDSHSLLMSPFHNTADGLLPSSTDICCWWDANRFTSPPLSAPILYKARENTFGGLGCFCGYPCALAWLQDHPSCHRYIPLLRFMRQNQSDTLNVTPLRPAPPREMLKMFGGSMSIEEFRQDPARGEMRMVHVPNMYAIKVHAENRNDTWAESSSVLQFLRSKKK